MPRHGQDCTSSNARPKEEYEGITAAEFAVDLRQGAPGRDA